MDIIRYGNDLNVTWSVFGHNGYKYSLTGRVYHLWLVSGPRKTEITSYSIQARNRLVFIVDKGDLFHFGAYKLVLQLKEPDSLVEEAAYDLSQVFQVVSQNYPMTTSEAVNGQCDLNFVSVLKDVYVSTLEGESAYEIAVRLGFEGTEAEWLASLVGVVSAEQTASSSESGGTNTFTFTLRGGSTVNFNVKNGAAGAAGASSLSGLSDVLLTSPSVGQALKWNGTRWVNGNCAEYSYGNGIRISEQNVISADIEQIASGLIAAGYNLSGGESGGEAGATRLSALQDVSLTVPVDGQVLTYDASISRWVARTPQSGGGSGGGGEIDPTAVVTITGSQTITGAKTFSAPVVLGDSIMIGSGATTAAEGAEGAKKRIYFGDTTHYIELNSNGFFFYGGGVYTNGFLSGGGLSQTGGGGGAGATTLGALTDVDLDTTAPTAGQTLVYDATNQIWKPGAAASGGGVFFGTCTTGKGSSNPQENYNKVVDCQSFAAANLSAGTILVVYMTFSENATIQTNPVYLNVNRTGLKAVITGTAYACWDAGEMVTLVYNQNGQWNLSPTYGYMRLHGGSEGTTVSWGTESNHVIPLTVGGVTKNVCLDGYNSGGSGGSSGSSVSVSRDQTSGDKVAVLTVDGSSYQLYSKSYDLSGYLPLLAGSGKALIGDLYARGIVPTTAGKISVNASTGAMSSLGEGYDIGSSSNPYRALFAKVIYLSYSPLVYMYYDTVNECVRVYGAGIATDSFVTAGGIA